MSKFDGEMKTEEVQNLIEIGLDGAEAEVTATVAWRGFEGMSLIQQHQAVYKTLGDYLTKEIHALQLKTSAQ